MTNVQTIDLLKRLGACDDATEWLGDRDLATAWRECPRGDWMLWLAASMPDRKPVVRAACACARLALPYVQAGEMRPLKAIDMAECWVGDDGVATPDQLNLAADAAFDAAYASAYTRSAAFAADAAFRAAALTFFDAHALAHTAAYTATDTANAALYAANAKRTETLAQCADIVRQHISAEMIVDALTAAQAVTE